MKGLDLDWGECMLGLLQWRIKFMFIHGSGTKLIRVSGNEFDVSF